MPIFQTKREYSKEVLYFCGSSKDWDNLIIKNSTLAKETFVCDPKPPKYPKHIKIIRSIDTAHRFLLGFSSKQDSIVFINAERNSNFNLEDNPFWSRTDCLVFKISIRQLMSLLKSGFLEINCRRNISKLRIYN